MESGGWDLGSGGWFEVGGGSDGGNPGGGVGSKGRVVILGGVIRGSTPTSCPSVPPTAACWEPDPHRRPPFGAIVRRLRALQPSALGPPDSFRGRQRKWRHEIRQRFERVRAREKVTT